MKHFSEISLIATVSFIGELLHYLIPLPVPSSIVGLIASYDSYKDILIPIVVISLVTTVLTMAVSGLTTQGLIRLQTKEEKEERAEALEACEKEEQTDVK